MTHLGELAAFFTSFCWTLSAVGFTRATDKLGPQVTNRVRVLIALILLALINAALYGQPIPLHAGASRWMWLSLSGIIGLALGDAFLFRAYQEIGPRLGLLLLSLAPIFGAAIAGLFLGQALTWMQMAGILVTLGGIAWVILVRPQAGDGNPRRASGRGILFGIFAAIGQSVGLVLSQRAMTESFSPFAGTLIRMLTAFIVLWVIGALQRQVGKTISTLRNNPQGLLWAVFGAVFGPVLGVSSSLLAVQHTGIGVASTLMALPPVFMLPLGYFIFKEQFGWQVVAGTLLAMAGVALLFA